MRHALPIDTLGAHGAPMAAAVEACVHCGFCLSGCPTYRLLGQEMDSPRGRIVLMQQALEGTVAIDDARRHVDRCLGCLGCVSHCPSGVRYGDLLNPFRALTEARRPRPLIARARRRLLHATFASPARFRLAARLGLLARPLRRLLPASWRAALELLPPRLPKAMPLAATYPARGRRRARVALFTGCVQQVLAPAIHRDTVAVLRSNGVEVLVPPGQGCCGALAWHGGDDRAARRLGRRNLGTLPADVDAVVTNAAGCGSALGEYGLIFRGTPDRAAAGALAERAVDVSAFLDQLGLEPPPPWPEPLRLAYHDACHLAHAQGVRAEPRRLLASIGEVTVVEIPDGDICCGSAGTYNLDQPSIAAALGDAKAAAVLQTGADAVAAGNLGCLVQIAAGLSRRGVALPLEHTMSWLARAYAGRA